MKLRAPAPLRQIFAIPAALAAISLAGLIAALLTTGAPDTIACAAAAAPLGAVGWAMWKRRA